MEVNRDEIRRGFEKHIADVEAELKKPKQDKLLNAMLVAMGVPEAIYQIEEMEKHNGYTKVCSRHWCREHQYAKRIRADC